ncbi:MAG: hypothetical protein ACTHO8_05080 [Solirubrobacterales bacterium]
MRDFDGKIRSKLKTTLGLFAAINGFTDAAVTTHSRVGASMVLMDGEELYAVLEERIGLPDVLHRKRRHAARTERHLHPSPRLLGQASSWREVMRFGMPL